MKLSKTSLCLIIIVSTVCLLLTPTTSLAKIHHLTILHTNDHRGHFMQFSPWGNPDVGGMAARSTLVNIVRAEVERDGGNILLLSAGNVNIGPPESDLLKAEPDFKLMNMLGYDAMTVGNHEFDIPREALLKQREWAEFPFLSANTVKRDTGESLFESYVIKELDGLRVAILGLTTEETAIVAEPKYMNDLEFRNEIETAKALVPKLREEADLVIALTNMGFYEEELIDWGRRAPSNVDLAKAVPGIDVIVGGRSHTPLEEAEVIEDTLIVLAGQHGLCVGRLDLTIDRETDKIIEYTYRLIPVNLKKEITYHDTSYYMYIDKGYVEDLAVLEFIQPYLEQVNELLSQPIGDVLVKLTGEWRTMTSQETNLANLVTDGMRSKTEAEITFQNAGGIGGGILTDIEPGPITYRDILKIHPFGSTVVLLDMTGEQVIDVLGYAATIKPGHGGFLQVSGLTWTNKKGIPENVMVGGVPIELDRMYKVVTNSFLAGGGDGYTMLKEIPQYNTGFTNASVLREYIMKLGKVAPKVEGRLTIIE